MPKTINKKNEFTQLDEKLYELQALFDLSKALNSSLNLKTILDTILLTPMGKMLIGKGVILIAKNSKGFVIETLKGLPKSLIGSCIQIDDFPCNPEYINNLNSSAWKGFFQKNGIEVVIPILHNGKNLGLIGLGNKILGNEFFDSELEYLNSLSNIAATSVQNGLIFKELNEVNKQLDKKVQELNTLFEIGKELNSTLETNTIVHLLAYSIMGELMVNRCLIFLSDDGSMKLKLNKGFQNATELIAPIETDICEALTQLEQPIIIHENTENKLYSRLTEMAVSVLIPMRIQNETKGVIALGEKITKLDFLNDELDFLTTLGNLSMISIENARLFEDALEKQRLEEELQIASDIQKQLLPNACPIIENYDIAAINIPSRQVGGDYFDCIKVNDHQYAFCIADVSGKGAPAALLMSNLQASLHALINTNLEIDEITSRINNLIHQNTGFDKFITYFLGILDLNDRTFTSVNAGHNPPYLFHRDLSFHNLEEGGLILGMMPNVPYMTETVQLQSGDCLVMFTDGVTEAMTAEEEEFEEKRVEASVIENYNSSAEEILHELRKSVDDFSKGQPQADDITILIIKII